MPTKTISSMNEALEKGHSLASHFHCAVGARGIDSENELSRLQPRTLKRGHAYITYARFENGGGLFFV
jgi:hypothetical protein